MLSTTDAIEVSVIVPCYNAEETLARCLAALGKQDFSGYEVIIVDNGSTDQSVAIVKQWQEDGIMPLKLVHEKTRGAAAARNRGVAEARGSWLAFTDSDCEPDQSWLSFGFDLIKQQKPVAMAGPAWGTMEGDSSAKLMGLLSLSVGMDEHWVAQGGPEGGRGFASANLWLKKTLFEALSGFDVNLDRSGEDVDLCNRLYLLHERILYHPKLGVRHIHQSGIKNMFQKMVSYGHAHAMLLQKFGQPGLQMDFTSKVLMLPSMYISLHLRPADKKLLLLLLFTVVYWPMGMLVPLYIFYMARFLKKKAAGVGHTLSWLQAYWMGCLLLVKSLGMTVGRIAGSSKHVWAL